MNKKVNTRKEERMGISLRTEAICSFTDDQGIYHLHNPTLKSHICT